jgi:hypothetical protein
MELEIGDLVTHKVHKDRLGYGMIITPTVAFRDILVCSVQWIETGYIHKMDIDLLRRIAEDKK